MSGSNETDDYRDPRYPQASRPPPTTPDPPPGPPDPRSPIRQLLDTYELEEERSSAPQTVSIPVSAGESEAGPAPAPPPPSAGAPATEPLVDGADASGASVHISAARIPFANWHITNSVLPAEFDTPLRMRMLDVISNAVPEPPPPPELDLDDDSILGELEKLIWEAVAKLQHAEDVEKAVQERVDKLKAGRALMPVVPVGQRAGTLQPVKYTTVIKGQNVDGQGWMFVEPEDSEYGKWLFGKLTGRYQELVDRWKALPDDPPAAKRKAWLDVAHQAAVIARYRQEGAPSAVNTYDNRILTWGSGSAASGGLPKIFEQATRDPKIKKTFYCCGFKFEIQWLGGAVPCGNYQIVDLTGDVPRVVYGDGQYHREGNGYKKGEINYQSHVALRALTAQKDLLYMLIQVARDPETRDTIFNNSYLDAWSGTTVAGAEKISSEALYVFIAMVQHNWGIKGYDPVGAAIRTMTADERGLPQPSEDFDKALAKGVARLVARVLQEQRFQNAVSSANKGKYPKDVKADDPIGNFPAATEYGVRRLLDYWEALQTAKSVQDGSPFSQDGSTVVVPDREFLGKEVKAGDYLVDVPARERPLPRRPAKRCNFGPADRMDLRLPHDEFRVLDASDKKNVKIRDTRPNPMPDGVQDATEPRK